MHIVNKHILVLHSRAVRGQYVEFTVIFQKCKNMEEQIVFFNDFVHIIIMRTAIKKEVILSIMGNNPKLCSLPLSES